ncbi:MAG TPA: PKD domain-containing protein [Chitinophaga sp.]
MEGTTQKNAIQNGSRNRVYLYVLLAVLVLAVFFLLLKLFFSDRTLNAHLLKDEIFLNENLVYTDNTPGAKQWIWEFGDGALSTAQNGFYRFKRSGNYLVRLTVDSKLQQQFAVVVKDTIAAPVMDSVRITGPTSGTTREQLRLEAEGEANIFEWSFGETGRVDVKGRTAFYTYNTPGKYRVMLRTDRSPVPVFFLLNITEPDDPLNNMVAPGAGAQALRNDFKVKLQNIANGQDFRGNYYYLVRKYLCNGERTSTQAQDETGKKNSDFYSYCIGLTFSKGIVIDEVTLSVAPNSQCVNLVNVQQHRLAQR